MNQLFTPSTGWQIFAPAEPLAVEFDAPEHAPTPQLQLFAFLARHTFRVAAVAVEPVEGRTRLLVGVPGCIDVPVTWIEVTDSVYVYMDDDRLRAPLPEELSTP